ncbi:MAG: short-chain fatty acid transporter [Deltaproteobacteria bacterium]|nr:short-chain fatty acid transporter [Deltaproteobacteria bacterium]
MIAGLGQRLSEIARRVVPDPFVLALGLTGIVLALGALNLHLDGQDGIAARIWSGWFDGFKDPSGLTFALQMCLILLTGHALALSPPLQRLLEALARLPRSGAQAALLVAATACVAGLVHWGLGAIVGALAGREIARKASGRIRLHYPLLGGAAYAGMAVWHGGLSGSAPLKVAEPGHFLEPVCGILPVSETLFSPLNLVVSASLLVGLPLLFWALSPPAGSEQAPPAELGEPSPRPGRERGALGWLQTSPWPGIGLGGGCLVAMAIAAWHGLLGFDLNSVNLAMLACGLMLHGSLLAYVRALGDGGRAAAAIVLQFPFYFAILGVLRNSGLVELVSQAFAQAASPGSFPVLTFLSAGLVNLFVPSGGGQWAVQGQVLLGAGAELGVQPGVTVMAFAYGDAWTNMLQPFWALPLLGIMGLQAKDIIGYTAVAFAAMGLLVPALLWLLA